MKRFFSSLNQNEDAEGASTSNNNARYSETEADQDEEPPTKQLKSVDEVTENLSQFLNCVICLDLLSGAIYQCRNGHLMCECCYERLLTESIMRKQQTRCPLCRVFIPKKKPVRCLCAERAATLLPVQCAHCSQTFQKAQLEDHEKVLCPARPAQCKFKSIGCKWLGTHAALNEHERNCEQSKLPLSSLLPNILVQQSEARASNEKFERLLESFNDGRLFFQDLCTAHYDYNSFSHTIYYNTDKFRVWDLIWSIKLKFVHPEYISENDGGGFYQVLLKSRPDRHMNVKFFMLPNANTAVNLPLQIHEHEFSSYSLESSFKAISLANNTDTYRILAKLKIHFRFVMIVMP